MRQSGTETGDFHYGMFVKQDAWERIKALPALEPRIVKPRGWAVGVINHKSPLMKEKKVRQAVQVVDWATLNHRTEKPEGWDMSSTGFVFAADPAGHVSLRCTFNGWWCNEEKERLLGELRQESDVKKRKAIVERIQTIYYEDVGTVKLGDYFTLDVARRDLRGDFRTAPRMYFWNTWLAK